MMNRQIFIISVLSKINDKYIDTATQRRYELMRRPEKSPRRRGWILGTALAASLCLLLSMTFFLFLPNGSKQVPVYEGMTVSTKAPSESLSYRDFTSLSAQKRPSVLSLSQLSEDTSSGESVTEMITETNEPSLEVNGSDTMYYAEQNQAIFITVHVNNPDNYEILSFTLNGKVYSSYMFEDGSDMENLILKYNVGDAEGIVEYTIDAIKYVDGTEIKDVLMEGDRTVKVGVYTENQPHVTVSNELVGINKIALTVALTDELGLLEISNGQVMARLTEGDRILSEKELSYKEVCEIIFDELSADTSYRCEIIAIYDALDGQGVADHVLFAQERRTEKFVAFDGVSVTQDSVSFNLLWNEKIDGADILSLALYQGETLIRELPVTSMKATGLLSDTEYTLVVSYRNSGAVEAVKATFITQAKAVPQLTVTADKITQSAISFAVNLTDPDGTGRIDKIELLHGTGTPVVESGNVRTFENLLSDNAYTVQVTAEYDLNDGQGAQTIVKTLDVRTLAKATPSLAVTAGTVTQSAIPFSVSYTDADKVGRVTKIELLHGTDTRVVEGGDVRMFENLLSDNAYTVRVTAEYDLNDGQGAQTIVKTLDIKTQAKTKPNFTFSDISTTKSTVSGTYLVSDVDAVLKNYSMALYQGSKEVASTSSKRFSFNGLENYTTYTVRISYRYDLSDGKGVQTAVVEQDIKTLPHLDVLSCKVINTSAVSDGETIYMQASIENPQAGKVTSVVVNGKTYGVAGTSTAERLYIEIKNDGQFAGGDTPLTVEQVTLTLDGTSYTVTPETQPTANVFINGKIELLNIQYVNEHLEPVSWYRPSASEQGHLLITLDNPTGYEVDTITLSQSLRYVTEVIGSFDNLTKLDASHYLIEDCGIYAGLVYVSELHYQNPYADMTLTGSPEISTYAHILASHETRYISTPEDLLNMDDNCYYELTGDIDLAEYEWHGGHFHGVLEGNGYRIKNMTCVTSVREKHTQLGLFADGIGIIQNLHMEGITILVDAIPGAFTERAIYYGALVGGNTVSEEHSLIVRGCTVDDTSTVSITDSSDQMHSIQVGGFIGHYSGDLCIVEDCINRGTISVSTVGGADIGGIVGSLEAISGEEIHIQKCINFGDIHLDGGGSASGIGGGNVGKVTHCSNYGDLNISRRGREGNCAAGIGIVPFISFCENYGNITCDEANYTGNTSDLYLTGIGLYTSQINDCINYGDITILNGVDGTSSICSIATEQYGMIQNCANFGQLQGSVQVMGIALMYDRSNSEEYFIGCINGGALNGKNGTYGICNFDESKTDQVINCYSLIHDSTNDEPDLSPLCTVAQLNDKSFWTETLGWDETIWSFDDLDFENGKYPTLRKN